MASKMSRINTLYLGGAVGPPLPEIALMAQNDVAVVHTIGQRVLRPFVIFNSGNAILARAFNPESASHGMANNIASMLNTCRSDEYAFVFEARDFGITPERTVFYAFNEEPGKATKFTMVIHYENREGEQRVWFVGLEERPDGSLQRDGFWELNLSESRSGGELWNLFDRSRQILNSQ